MSTETGKRKVWPTDYTASGDNVGISCPKCGCKRSEVYYVRSKEGGRRMRRRTCGNCGWMYTTFEHI